MVIHDERIDRTTSDGKGLVKDMTLEELRQFDFSSYFDTVNAGLRILPPKEGLEIIRECKLISTEIKKQPHLLWKVLKKGVGSYPGI